VLSIAVDANRAQRLFPAPRPAVLRVSARSLWRWAVPVTGRGPGCAKVGPLAKDFGRRRDVA
jgi:hypothetical protein